MNGTNRIFHYIILPILAVLLLPPEWFGSSALVAVILVAILFIGLGVLLLQGRSTALTLLIFIMGFNVIIRLMMFFPHFANTDGTVDLLFGLASIASIALSTYLMLRLDKVDVRVQMVR